MQKWAGRDDGEMAGDGVGIWGAEETTCPVEFRTVDVRGLKGKSRLWLGGREMTAMVFGRAS